MAADPYDEQVTHVYVARRALDAPGIPKAGAVAHSAVLVKTKSGYFVIEYGAGSNAERNTVRWGAASAVSEKTFSQGGFHWTKQEKGVALSNPTFTFRWCIKTMEQPATKSEYHLIDNNCHMAQEALRRAMGLKIDSPYNPAEVRLLLQAVFSRLGTWILVADALYSKR